VRANVTAFMRRVRDTNRGREGLRAYLLEAQHFGLRMAIAPCGQHRLVVTPPQLFSESVEAFKAWRIQEANLDRQGWRAAEPDDPSLPPAIQADPELWGLRIELAADPDWHHLAPIDLAYKLAKQSLRLAEMRHTALEESFIESFLKAESEIGVYARLRGSGFGQGENKERDQELMSRYAELRPRYVGWLQQRAQDSNMDPVGGGDTLRNKTMEAI
jgi:hypothetical protein